MKELKCELHIVGAALTGLLTAYCASQLNYKIIISEKKKILSNLKKAISDKRTTAIAEGSKTFLESQGLWQYIRVFAEPIHNIKVIDKTAESKLYFSNPKENSNLGYIVENSKLIQVLIKLLKKKKNVSIVEGSSISSINAHNSKILSFSKNEKISSEMIIAADGKNSAVRKILGTNVFKKHYNEKALVINFYHEKPHKNIAYEFFFKTGPLAILPMQNNNNNFGGTFGSGNMGGQYGNYQTGTNNYTYQAGEVGVRFDSNLGKPDNQIINLWADRQRVQRTYTYNAPGTYTYKLKVTYAQDIVPTAGAKVYFEGYE